jgi:spermidine/putrescine transport system substrate-binding protein
MQHRNPRLHSAHVSRRQFLVRSGLFGAAGLTLPQLLAACGGSEGNEGTAGAGTTGTGASAGTTAAPGGTAAAGGGGSLRIENWPAYIDPTADGATGTVDRFTEATGISVNYTEGWNDNNEYFAKIQPLLGAGDPIDIDIISPTFWLAARLISLGWVEKLPIDQVPNAANLRDDLVNPTWDPTGEYSLPWQTGMTGIAYNLDATGRDLTSVEDLFDPAFNGKIGMLTEMRDTLGLILLGLGKDPSTVASFDDVADGFDKIDKAKADGQIRQFTGNDYLDDLTTGNFAACIGWSGDVLQLGKDNPSVKFVIPDEGGMLWADTMMVPKGAENVAAAAQWMNFVYDPVQQAQLTAWVQYISPVKGVQEELAKIDPELAENPLLFPDEATSSRLRSFAAIDEETEAAMDERFAGIVGA